MSRFLLDTHILEWAFDPSHVYHQPCLENLSRILDDDEIFVHILTIYEFEYSLANTTPLEYELKERIHDTIHYIPNRFKIAQLSTSAASVFGNLKAGYKILTGISPSNIIKHNFDLMIASTALVLDACVVSNDNIFLRLNALEPRLKTIDWTLH